MGRTGASAAILLGLAAAGCAATAGAGGIGERGSLDAVEFLGPAATVGIPDRAALLILESRKVGAPPAGTGQYTRPGPYLGAGGRLASASVIYKDGHPESGGETGACFFAGWRFSPYWALEAIADRRSTSVSDSDAFRKVDADVDSIAYGIQVRIYLVELFAKLTERDDPHRGENRLQPYMVTGFGFGSTSADFVVTETGTRAFEVDEPGFFSRLALGAEFFVTRNFAVYLELDFNTQAGLDLDVISTGLGVGTLVRF